MTSKVLICEHCFENIARKKPNYAKVWYDLCVTASLDKRTPRPKEKIARIHFDKAVEYLEQQKYIITTEIGIDDYAMRILGYFTIENEEDGSVIDTFCVNEDHLEELEDSV